MPESIVEGKNGGGYTARYLRRTEKCLKCDREVVVYCSLKGKPQNKKRSGLCRRCSQVHEVVGKFQLLTILEEIPSTGNGRRFKVLCDCGVITSIDYSNLGTTKSCGHLSKLPSGRSERNRLLRSYKANAKARKITWKLTEEEFDTLTQSPCHYCGEPPALRLSEKGSNGGYICNGIDRKNNKQGYLSENVVPCCKTCNWLKNTMPYEDFLSFILKAGRYQLFSPREPLTEASHQRYQL